MCGIFRLEKMAQMITDLDTQSFNSIFFCLTLYFSAMCKICGRSSYFSPAHSTKINIGVYFSVRSFKRRATRVSVSRLFSDDMSSDVSLSSLRTTLAVFFMN